LSKLLAWNRKSQMLSLPLLLKALNPPQNVNRWYSLRIGQDLFGEWILLTQWGRNGFKGQSKEYVFSNEDLAQKKFQYILKKRLNAQKRIGCNYVRVKN